MEIYNFFGKVSFHGGFEVRPWQVTCKQICQKELQFTMLSLGTNKGCQSEYFLSALSQNSFCRKPLWERCAVGPRRSKATDALKVGPKRPGCSSTNGLAWFFPGGGQHQRPGPKSRRGIERNHSLRRKSGPIHGDDEFASSVHLGKWGTGATRANGQESCTQKHNGPWTRMFLHCCGHVEHK